MGMSNTIKSLVRLCRTTLAAKDDKAFQTQQVEYFGKVGDAIPWFPYGIHANVPADKLCLMFNLHANNEARFTFPSS